MHAGGFDTAERASPVARAPAARAGFEAAAAALMAVSGRLHPVPSGLARFLTGLWTTSLRFDAADPGWPDRDRFVLSDGAMSGLLYGLLHLSGFEGMESSVLDRFGQLHCAAAPRPLPALHPAIEAASGSPAQGLAAAVGLALAERAMAARFGRSLVDHRTWVLASSTELAAGLGQEAGSIAGALRLDRLAVVFEETAGQQADEQELMRRFAACGWTVRTVDGRDHDDVVACLSAVTRSRRPTLIGCRASSSFVQAGPAREPAPDILDGWRRAGARGAGARRAWLKRLSGHASRADFEHATEPRPLPDTRRWAAPSLRAGQSTGGTWEATLSCLDAIAPASRSVVFLSSTRASPAFDHLPPIGHAQYGGRHLPCGGQEHGMATLANGLALHGGVLPVCAAPAIAADRIRPALRLAALTGRKLVQLFTEDGLSSAAEGAAFQPVEQLAGLRAMPGLFVFRPACATEASECLELALRRSDGPSVIMLSSTSAPALRDTASANACRRGGYVLADAPGSTRHATLIASGTELTLALDARRLLAGQGITVAVVSLPCWELFDRQEASYRAAVLGSAPRLGIEAAHGFGWERWLGEGGRFVGLDGFGASGGYDELRTHVGLTAERVAGLVQEARGSAPEHR